LAITPKELNQKDPDYDWITRRCNILRARTGSNWKEKRYTIIASYILAFVKHMQLDRDDKIAEEVITEYEDVKIHLIQLITTSPDISPPDPETLAKLHYNAALCAYRIGQIKQDLDNTSNSKIPYTLASDSHTPYFEEARCLLAIAVDQFESHKHLNLLGVLCAMLEEFPKALFYFNRSLEVSFKKNGTYSPIAMHNKALLFYKDKRYHEALDLFHANKIASEKDGELDVASSQSIADCLLNLRRYYEAEEYYWNNMKESDDIYHINGYVICRIYFRSFYDAEKLLDNIFKKNNFRIPIIDSYFDQLDKLTVSRKKLMVESLTIKAYILLRTNREEIATSFLESAEIIINRYRLDLVAPLFLKGIMLIKEKEYEKGLGIFETILRTKLDFVQAHYCAGICHCNLGEYQQGIIKFNDALELQPGLTPAYLQKQQVEGQMNTSGSFDLMRYWTGSKAKTIAFVLLISFAFTVTLFVVLFPSQETTETTMWNNTAMINNSQDYDSRVITTKAVPNYFYLSLALVIGIILLILWPSIKNFKLGVNTLEIEKIDYPEKLTELSVDWLNVDIIRESFGS
jgi:tetratricopeptide (TPR) repeat protein